jgi:putative addiction module component (TIGR02574 family)
MPSKLIADPRSLSSQFNARSAHRLSEIDDAEWLDGDDLLAADEKTLLEIRLAAYETDPNAGSSWDEVENRIQSQLSAANERSDLLSHRMREANR